MKSLSISPKIVTRASAALLLVAGLATPAAAVDKSWNCNSGQWTDVACWFPVGIPAAGDVVHVGNVVGVQNNTVRMNQNDSVLGLQISDGMSFRTDGFAMLVGGHTLVSGSNNVNTPLGLVNFRSTLRVIQSSSGADYTTNSLSIADNAQLQLDGNALLVANGDVANGSNCHISGYGFIHFSDSGTNFTNEGTIEPDVGGLTFVQLGNGLYDLDGVSNNGRIDLTTPGGVDLSIFGPALADMFSSDVDMTAESVLHVAIAEGWAADTNSVFTVTGVSGGGPARLTGNPFYFWGHLDVLGPDGHFRFEASTIFQASADIYVDEDNRLEVVGAADINGGDFYLDEDARLDFQGTTVINGGDFFTFSTLPGDGTVNFNGPTEWAGTVNIDGIARQHGAATVTGPTVINASVFDMDGNSAPSWNIQNSLTINAQSLDTGSSNVSGDITVAGVTAARLTVNLDEPGETWEIVDELTLGHTPGAAHIPALRILGSHLRVLGDLNVPTGRVRIGAPVTLHSTSTVNIAAASAELRLDAASIVRFGATFQGSGILTSSTAGDMTIESGVNTAAVGLTNQGTMRIGDLAGIASVNRFDTSGTWEVQLGGNVAGAEYDRLIVTGTAAVGGVLEIEHINNFHPAVGSSYTILTAGGGVSGAFPAQATSSFGGFTYNWSVASNPTDVVLTLDHITSPCTADFNADGVVNSQDFFDFLTAFFAENPSSDVNADGVINSQDFFDFMIVFFNGCL